MKIVRFGAALAAAALPYGAISLGLLETAHAQAPTIQAAPASVAPPAAPAPPPDNSDLIALQKIAQTPIANVADVDKRLADLDAFVEKYPNSPYKGIAFTLSGQAGQMKGDHAKAIASYKKALELDPKDHVSMLMIAAEMAQSVVKFDLQLDSKLADADKMLSQAIAIIPTATKPNPQITDEQWEMAKKDDMAQAYETAGLIALARAQDFDSKNDSPKAMEKYTEAAKQFQLSIETAVNKQPATYVRLGGALNEAKRYDEATKVLDQVLAVPNLPDQIKKAAENEKLRTTQLRSRK